MTRTNPMLTAPIPVVLRQMTGPMIFGIIAILAFNLVDTFFIGMLGTQALAAISFTFPVTFVVTSLAMGLGAGLSAVIGHTLGQGKHDEAAHLATDSLFLAVIMVALLSVGGALTIKPLFTLLGASAELISLIHDYMLIWYLTVPMLVLPMVGNAAIRATGDTKTPSVVMAVAGLVNGVLDPLLIFGIGPFPEWGIRGAAIATSISWLMAMLVSLYILRHREGLLLWRLSARPRLFQHWRSLLHVAVPASFTNMLNPLANAVLMTFFAGLGTEVVAAYGAASRVEALLLIVMMALASVLAPFISQNCGAGNPARAKGCVAKLYGFCVAVPARHLWPDLVACSLYCQAVQRAATGGALDHSLPASGTDRLRLSGDGDAVSFCTQWRAGIKHLVLVQWAATVWFPVARGMAGGKTGGRTGDLSGNIVGQSGGGHPRLVVCPTPLRGAVPSG